MPSASQLVLPSWVPLYLFGSYLQREGQRKVSSQGHQLMHLSAPWWSSSSSQQRREKLPVRLPARPGQEGGRGGLPRLSIPQRVGTREVATLTIPSVPQNKCQPWPPACVMPLGCQMPLHFQVAKSPALCTNAVCFSRAVPAWPRFRCIVDVPLTSIARI